MRELLCEQRSPLWFQFRCGIPSASSFDKIITTTGQPSKQREKYLFKLAGERVSGMSEASYQNGAMQRGIELESEAREMYSLITDLEVKEVGFCLADDFNAGASPDGSVGDDGLLEIKCPSAAVHVGYVIDKKLPTDYFQQTQGQLLITSRRWCDFLSYYPGIKPLLIRVERDEVFISALRTELIKFCKELDEVVEKLK